MPRNATWAGAAALALLAAAPLRPARACDCEIMTIGEAITSADAVVVATFVRSIDHTPRGARRRGTVVEYVARVERTWKGARAGDTISLWDTGSSCDTIGRPWRGPWVFFARRDEQGRLVPGHCDRPVFHYRMRLPAIVAAIDSAARGPVPPAAAAPARRRP